MSFSVKRVTALFFKEIKDFSKNMNVFMICFLPVFLTFFTVKVQSNVPASQGDTTLFQLISGININLLLVGACVMAILISEEKEKNTMRTLMLSSVSPFEFLAGKALLLFIITTINNIAVFFIVGVDIQLLPIYLLVTTLVVISMLIIGSTIGLLSPNQMATGVLATPITIFFIFIPMLVDFNVNEIFRYIALSLPNYNLQLIIGRTLNGLPINFLSKEFLIIVGWIGLSLAIFTYAYGKKGLDK